MNISLVCLFIISLNSKWRRFCIKILNLLGSLHTVNPEMVGTLGFYTTDDFYGTSIVGHHLMPDYNFCGVFMITLIDIDRHICRDIKCLIVFGTKPVGTIISVSRF